MKTLRIGLHYVLKGVGLFAVAAFLLFIVADQIAPPGELLRSFRAGDSSKRGL